MLAQLKPSLAACLRNEFGAMDMPSWAELPDRIDRYSVDGRYKQAIADGWQREVIATVKLRTGKRVTQHVLALADGLAGMFREHAFKMRDDDSISAYIEARKNHLIGFMFPGSEPGCQGWYGYCKAFQRAIKVLVECGLIYYQPGKCSKGENGFNQPVVVILRTFLERDGLARRELHYFAYSSPALMEAYLNISREDKLGIERAKINGPGFLDLVDVVARDGILAGLAAFRAEKRELRKKLSTLSILNPSSDSKESSEEFKILNPPPSGEDFYEQASEINDKIEAAKLRLWEVNNASRLAARKRDVIAYFRMKDEAENQKFVTRQKQIAEGKIMKAEWAKQMSSGASQAAQAQLRERDMLRAHIYGLQDELTNMTDSYSRDHAKKADLHHKIRLAEERLAGLNSPGEKKAPPPEPVKALPLPKLNLVVREAKPPPPSRAEFMEEISKIKSIEGGDLHFLLKTLKEIKAKEIAMRQAEIDERENILKFNRHKGP